MSSTNSKQLIGLSLPDCIKDITSGEVFLGDVRYIVTSSQIMDGNWDSAIGDYRRFNGWSDAEEEIFRFLLGRGQIEQPRIEINNYPSLADNRTWVMRRSDIRWEYEKEG